jgi:predicted ATPase/DNA-binding SARP family transcriptional activator
VTAPPGSRHNAVVDRTDLALRVDVLGPLVLHVGGAEVDVPGTRRRALLALLAVEGDRGLSSESLIDALWPDDPPENPAQALYSHIFRLRAHLGPLADRLERRVNGYRLRLQPFELDADAARRLAPSDPQAALALWGGPALGEFQTLPYLESTSVGLEELRLKLVDDVLAARLAGGDPNVAVDAAAAAAVAPLREPTALLHVRALAADGRTAEAMDAARSFRRRLAEETGLDPTEALAELEQQVAGGSVQRRPAVRRVAAPDAPMIGRQHDRAELVRLLGTHAVVTLTGPGGVGKTRLALDIAADLPSIGDTVVVPLAVLDRADRVGQAVVASIGLRIPGDAGPDQIAAGLADRDLLLVLDNCEHVGAACRELVVALRRRAPGVRVLATSRATLGVPGEYVVRLQPLPVPNDATDLESLRRQPSARAFVEYARLRVMDFQLTAEEAPDLVEVLRRLDGLPLGIELAARQVAVMPLRAVRERLDRALDLSTGHQGYGDERQRTLRTTIASSYDLLSADEKWLLRAVAPFIGGVDLTTVEVLAQDLQSDPLDLLHRLVDASLLVADPLLARYRTLFTVRAFLVDEIARLGEQDQFQARFVERCREVADDIGARMSGPAEADTDRRLRAEVDNFRAARDIAPANARVAITLAVNRVVTWRDLRELWAWAVELAEDPALRSHPERATILAGAAEAARLVGDFDTAAQRADEAIATADPETQQGALSRAWSVQAAVAHFRADFAAARNAWLRAGEGAGAGADASAYVGSAALAAAYCGDLTGARHLLDRARSMAVCGSQRAFVAYVEGELLATTRPEDAVPFYVEAIAQASSVGCTFVEGVSRVSLASTLARIGDVPGAADGFGYLIAFWRRTGQTTQLWTTARNAAGLLAAAGHPRTAALLLVCADTAHGAASVNEEIARFSGRSYTPPEALVPADELGELRSEAQQLGPARILDRAHAELDALATLGEPLGPATVTSNGSALQALAVRAEGR